MTELLRTHHPSLETIAKRVYQRLKRCREALGYHKKNVPFEEAEITLRKRW